MRPGQRGCPRTMSMLICWAMREGVSSYDGMPRLRSTLLCSSLTPFDASSSSSLTSVRRALIEELFFLSPGQMKKQKIYIEPPIFCDYGFNVKFEGSFYANTGITVLDDGLVIFGDRCILAPGVQILGTTHSVTDMQERRAGYQRAHTIRLGKEGRGCTHRCLIYKRADKKPPLSPVSMDWGRRDPPRTV